MLSVETRIERGHKALTAYIRAVGVELYFRDRRKKPGFGFLVKPTRDIYMGLWADLSTMVYNDRRQAKVAKLKGVHRVLGKNENYTVQIRKSKLGWYSLEVLSEAGDSVFQMYLRAQEVRNIFENITRYYS